MKFFTSIRIYYVRSLFPSNSKTMLIITSMAFGENLRKLRKEKGLSQQELAKKAGVSQQVIGHYEKGIRAPKLEQAIMVAKALGMSVEELYGQLERKRPAATTPRRHKNTRAAKMEEVFELLPADKQKAILDHAKALLKQ